MELISAILKKSFSHIKTAVFSLKKTQNGRDWLSNYSTLNDARKNRTN